MKGEVQIPYAWNPNTGSKVHVDDIETGLACGLHCLDCGERLQAKNAGEVRAHHFAHNQNVPTCEGLLHATVKQAFFQRMEKALSEGQGINIHYSCESCPCTHRGNLLKRVATVKLENVIDGIRPDISTWGDDGTVAAFVEVVHTHPPSQQVHAVAKQHRVPVVELMVVGERDIERAENSHSLSVKVRHSPCPCEKGQCEDCGQKKCDKYGPQLPHKRCDQGPVSHCISVSDVPCYCPVCDDCPDEPHRHCVCGNIINGSYNQCFCCYVGCGVGRNRAHRHCEDCRRVITAIDKKTDWFYKRCWPCEMNYRAKELAKETNLEAERQVNVQWKESQMAMRSEDDTRQWAELNEWFRANVNRTQTL